MNIPAHRALKNYHFREKLARVLWAGASPLFARSPRFLYGWRNMLLRLFGAKVGRAVRIYPSVRIFAPWQLEVGDWATLGPEVLVYNLGNITIGASTVISQGAHLCAGTHDYTKPEFPLLKLPIHIGDEVWIAAEAFVGPGVTVGKGAVLGARAVVMKSVAAGKVAVGNPARMLRKKKK